jgi:hypothetical protein
LAAGANGREREEALRALFRGLAALDEFALAEHREKVNEALEIGVAQFNRYLRTAQNEAVIGLQSGRGERYVVDGNRLCVVRYGRDGERYPEPVCNFTAEVTEEIVRDDGEDAVRQFNVAGTLETGRPLLAARVDAAKFMGMARNHANRLLRQEKWCTSLAKSTRAPGAVFNVNGCEPPAHVGGVGLMILRCHRGGLCQKIHRSEWDNGTISRPTDTRQRRAAWRSGSG